MPELDGIQTLRELRRLGSPVKAVLNTLHEADELVIEAINAGANAYVVKTRMFSDLARAMDHALGGRLFVPSLTSLTVAAGDGHTVQFHMNDSAFLEEVSHFVGSTLCSGEPIVIAATGETRDGITHRLRAQGIDLKEKTQRGQYIVMDAGESLSQFMRDGRPDAKRLTDVVGSLNRLRLSSESGSRSRLTIFGEMAVILCRNGNITAALELERIWDELTKPLPLHTVCSYPIACFQDGLTGNAIASISAEHFAVTQT
jgi:hypothetical protein